ncbi:MAG: NUDIX hydrolase [Acidiferrobacterales bacterium]
MRSIACLLFGSWLFLGAAGSFAQEKIQGFIKAAGCFIPMPEGVVVGIGRFSGAIHVPIGSHEPGESARETAARETREEIGLDVTVGPLLKTFEKNTVLLFLCRPKAPVSDYSKLSPVDGLEIAEVLVLDPVTMRNHDGRKITNAWRFPDDQRLLIELFDKYGRPN